MQTKYGVVDENSKSDFDTTKPAKYQDKKGFEIADEENKEKLKEPETIKENK